jgi:hypothetical protein
MEGPFLCFAILLGLDRLPGAGRVPGRRGNGATNPPVETMLE